MTVYQITYMVDPGDGLQSAATYSHESDDMAEALVDWFNQGNEHFIVKCEIIEHPLMVK